QAPGGERRRRFFDGPWGLTDVGGPWVLFGGLAAQAALFTLLAVLSGELEGAGSNQSTGVAVACYFITLATYAAVDAPFIAFFEMHWLPKLYEAAGVKNCMEFSRMPLAFLFFPLAALGDTVLCVLPGLDFGGAEGVLVACFRGFVLGSYVYGTLALAQCWTFKNFPLETLGVFPLAGALLNTIASALPVVIFNAARGGGAGGAGGEGGDSCACPGTNGVSPCDCPFDAGCNPTSCWNPAGGSIPAGCTMGCSR
ncbi:MAG: hypothetical protein CMI16_12655, partial [Opitutaceae bacterium]|nr:hypothetical protein [Opitutaceae bacterium]